MELITGTHLQIITNCVDFARRFLLLPDTIEYYFEDCPSQRFPTPYNAAESSITTIVLNKQWFLQRIDEHRDDLEFFIFHELRHIHQLHSIYLHENGKKCNDDAATIAQWKCGFDHYIRNTGADTQAANITQEVEIDANAYAQCLANFLHVDDNMELHFSLPEEAANISFERSKQYYMSKPELKRFVDKLKNQQQEKRDAHQKHLPIRKGQKVGANDPCPCGSGNKFKRCCRGKGIYD